MILRYLLCLTLLFTITAAAQDVVPETLVRSKYVYIGIFRADGGVDDSFNPSSSPEDRKVRAEVEKAFSHWKRFTVTQFPKDADLIVLVRKGRYGSVTVSGTPVRLGNAKVQVGRGPKQDDQTRRQPDLSVGGEAAVPPGDLFQVHYGPNRGDIDTILWKAMRKDGFNGQPPLLFIEYKDAVERAAKKLGL